MNTFLAQPLVIYQTLFHTFIFRKFGSLPNSFNQPEKRRTHVTKLSSSASINTCYLGSPYADRNYRTQRAAAGQLPSKHKRREGEILLLRTVTCRFVPFPSYWI